MLNVINTPAEATDCLKTCINIATEGYTEKEKTRDRLRVEKGILVDYNTIETNPDVENAFSIYESPFPIHDIPPLAKNLHTKFNILKLHNVGNKKFEISTLYTDGSATHNILFFNNHFYYINDLDKLMTFVTKRRRDQRELCINCLHYFDKRYISLDRHRLQCKLGKGSIIRYPKDGQMKEYNQYNFQVKSPFMIVADLEATNSSNTTIPSTPSSEVKKIHGVNSYAFFLHIDPDLDNFPYEEFSERLYLHHVVDNSEEAEQALIAKFMRQVYDISERLTSWQNNIDQESQLIKLKNDNSLDYASNNICIYCKEETIDHDHCRNRYNRPAHSKCNMRANKQKEVPLFSTTLHTMLI